MEAKDILELIRAGYTKADIDALGIALEKPEEPKPEEPKPEEPKPEEKKPEEKKPEESDQVKALETKIDYLVNRLNLLAVQNSQQKDEKTESVEEILAAVVRGNKKEE